MSRCITYQSGGFTNYGISYRKYSQEELEERKTMCTMEWKEVETGRVSAGCIGVGAAGGDSVMGHWGERGYHRGLSSPELGA